jgi:hypothetical protein
MHACRRGTLQVRAHIMVFDFRSLITQSSFLSTLKVIQPRNLVLLQRPPAPSPLLDAVRSVLKGGFSHVHTPTAGERARLRCFLRVIVINRQ